MTVRLAAIFLLVLAATPVAAQTPPTPDSAEPRLYQTDTPVAIKAPAGQTRTV
ncbi:MAG: hypothetical protein JF571_13585, partial [Asticcacaulis sp.]|nr:hypothetical protein [Asticcacaulis sp.]